MYMFPGVRQAVQLNHIKNTPNNSAKSACTRIVCSSIFRNKMLKIVAPPKLSAVKTIEKSCKNELSETPTSIYR